ncbi:SSSF family transport protein [Halobacterium hubeiense]|uniref:SSSF family transport protein n=2 Tax=Halobacterium hubeiense TaxID=1407499 RepID=A0A0U5H234_9EURY|nr:sodium/proline symporter [Halobacterium hubeiense]CQH53757.1 SSSF family transport protein [Halobacterium hubeiense]
MAEAIAGGAGAWVLGTFAAYLVVLVGIGVWASKFMDTVGDYVVGGREIGPVVTGFSERASEMSGWLTLGVPADAYSSGVMAFYNGLGMIPADLLAWAGIAKRLRKYSEIVRAVTLPTFFATRLRDDTGLVKAVSSIVLIVFEGGYVGAQIVAAGTLLRVLTGIEMWVGIVAGGVIVVGYTMLGGYFAVAWSDYFQGAIILAAFAVLPIIAYATWGLPFGDLAAMDNGASLTSVTGGATGWAALFGIISYAAIGLGVPGNPHIMVRFMGIDRVENVRTAAVVAQLFMFVAYVGAALVGLYALVQFGDLANTDNAMPMVTLELLPGALAGVVLAAALAAMMSSADSQLLVATSAVVEDVYHGFLNEQATEEQLVRYSRYVTLAIGFASIGFAYVARETPIYTLVLDYAWGGLGASLGPLLIAALWWKRVTVAGAVASMVTGTTTMILWTQWTTILGEATIEGLHTALSGLLTVYGLFPAFVLSALVLVVVSLATTPPDREALAEDFDVMRQPLSAVVEDDYATDGGTPEPKAVTELDNVRGHVADSDYWDEQ